MTTARLTFLIVSVWLVVVIGLIVGIMGVAHSADMSDCQTYATRGSASALKALLPFPFIDVAAGKFLYRKAYTFCVNADEMPPLVFTPEEQPIVDGLPAPRERPPPPPASVPAVDLDDPAPAPAPVEEAKPAPKGKALCIKHGKRTLYRGKHWRCVKWL